MKEGEYRVEVQVLGKDIGSSSYKVPGVDRNFRGLSALRDKRMKERGKEREKIVCIQEKEV